MSNKPVSISKSPQSEAKNGNTPKTSRNGASSMKIVSPPKPPKK